MKKTFLLPLVVILSSGNIQSVFAQEKTESSSAEVPSEQIKTLHKELNALKKANKEDNEYMEREIDFLNLSKQETSKLLETHDIRIMTNKILIQGALEGTIAQIKESQEETYQGYARTRKIVYAALGTLLFLCCCFLVSLILIFRRNKKNFFLLDKMLWQIKNELDLLTRTHEKEIADLKTELAQLRIEWRLGAEARQQAIDKMRLEMENIEATARAHKKLSEERTTSLAYFQQQMEDNLESIKQTVKRTANLYEKEALGLEERLAAVETKTDKLKITH